MNTWTTRSATSLAILVGVPVAVEALIAYIKGEDYSWLRAAAVLASLLGVVLVLLIIHHATRRLQLVLESVLVALGVVTSGCGVVIISSAPGGEMRYAGVAVTSSGVLIMAVSAYLMFIAQTGADLTFAIRRAGRGRTDREVRRGEHTILERTFTAADDDSEVRDLCLDVTDPADVQFLAYYVDGTCRFHLDVLSDERLNRFFRGVSREQRRSAYERAGRQLWWVVARLNVYTRKLNGGILIRTVLDVEQGALYHYWISDNAYLTAITLDQAQVLHADEKLRRLANALGTLPHGGTMGVHIPQTVAAKSSGEKMSRDES